MREERIRSEGKRCIHVLVCTLGGVSGGWSQCGWGQCGLSQWWVGSVWAESVVGGVSYP